jgi:hypothetical protein
MSLSVRATVTAKVKAVAPKGDEGALGSSGALVAPAVKQ